MTRTGWRVVVGTAAVMAAATTALAGCSQGSSSSPSSAPSPTDNGVSALSAQDILAKATDAATAQSSVQVVANGGSGKDAITFDISMSKTSGASGSMTNGGQTVQFFATEANTWLKASRSFWTDQASPAAAELVGDKWVKVPNSNADFATFAGFGNYSTGIAEMLKPGGAVTKGELTTLNGQKAIILVSSKGQLWIATTGDPLPIQLQSTGSDSGTVTFSKWGSATVGSAPAAADTIDINKLQS